MSKAISTPSEATPWFCFDGEEYTYFDTEHTAYCAANAHIQDSINTPCELAEDESISNIAVGRITYVLDSNITGLRPAESDLDEDGYDNEGTQWPEGVDRIVECSMLSIGARQAVEKGIKTAAFYMDCSADKATLKHGYARVIEELVKALNSSTLGMTTPRKERISDVIAEHNAILNKNRI